ncbi:hypothetical protein [Microbacterium halotolerans]|uniref:hypothetical protein n=1 Tax=Microbacterium halotolerans TaxID=246613 RepID=UPI000E6AAF30|nr:hypothetical protein [Microbacterium halotolerans]
MSDRSKYSPVVVFERPESLHSLRELAAAGYGSRKSLLARISADEIPAVQVGNAYKIRHSDLPLLAVPRNDGIRTADAEPSHASPPGHASEHPDDELATMAARLVTTWPRLDDERKRELGHLLLV